MSKIKKVFLICPVRDASDDQKIRMKEYIESLEADGIAVHYPARDTNQNDPIGFRICYDNAYAIREADEIHIFWDKNSTGSLFDLGVAFAYEKDLRIVNIDDLTATDGKSFTNMIIEWNKRSIDGSF